MIIIMMPDDDGNDNAINKLIILPGYGIAKCRDWDGYTVYLIYNYWNIYNINI